MRQNILHYAQEIARRHAIQIGRKTYPDLVSFDFHQAEYLPY
jgi:hypothetical protein